jgi:hypothetical protein
MTNNDDEIMGETDIGRETISPQDRVLSVGRSGHDQEDTHSVPRILSERERERETERERERERG